MDIRILKIAKKYRLDYTRYSDDLTFSTNNKHFLNTLFYLVLTVFLDVFNNLEISFLDMPRDKYLKIYLYFSSYCFKIKNSFLVKYFVDTLLIYTLILQEKEWILYD